MFGLKRKRIRDDDGDDDGRHVKASTGSTIHGQTAHTLAGQLASPRRRLPADDKTLRSDPRHKGALGSKRCRHKADDADHDGGPTRLFQSPQTQNSGWSMLALGTLGGAVGRMWEFCKAGAFRGFYSGGGQGFDMKCPPHEHGGLVKSHDESVSGPKSWSPDDDDNDKSRHNVPSSSHERDFLSHGQDPFQAGSCTPGAWPFPVRPSTLVQSGPAVVKKRREATADDLSGSWVLVKDRTTGNGGSFSPRQSSTYTSSYTSSQRNRNQGPSATTGRRISTPNGRRVVDALQASAAPFKASPRASVVDTRTCSLATHDAPPSTPPPRSFASFASPRSPSHAKPSLFGFSEVPSPCHDARRRCNVPGSQQPSTHRRSHSGASTASHRGGTDDVGHSPRLDAEAKHLAAQRQQQDRHADARISALNKQLRDMIRQGKEALGTTIQIDGDDGEWESS